MVWGSWTISPSNLSKADAILFHGIRDILRVILAEGPAKQLKSYTALRHFDALVIYRHRLQAAYPASSSFLLVHFLICAMLTQTA